jgi:hypothetical protein
MVYYLSCIEPFCNSWLLTGGFSNGPGYGNSNPGWINFFASEMRRKKNSLCVSSCFVWVFPGASIHWRKNLTLPRAAFSSSQILEPLAPMRLVSLIVGFDTSHYKGCCFFLFFCTFVVYFTGCYLITWNHVRSICVKLELNCGLWKLNLMVQKLNFMIFVVWVRPLCWPKKSARMLLRLRAM